MHQPSAEPVWLLAVAPLSWRQRQRKCQLGGRSARFAPYGGADKAKANDQHRP